jgi:hypothetical protein
MEKEKIMDRQEVRATVLKGMTFLDTLVTVLKNNALETLDEKTVDL